MTEGRPFDAGDADAVGKRRKDARRQALSTESTVRLMLNTEAARRFFWSYLSTCGIFQQDCLPMEQMYYRAGERNAALRLYSSIPEDLKVLMSNEAKEATNA